MKSHRKVFIFQAERKTDSRSPLCERSYVIISQINKSILFSGAKRRYLTETSDGKVTNECMALQEFLLIKKRAIYKKKIRTGFKLYFQLPLRYCKNLSNIKQSSRNSSSCLILKQQQKNYIS